MMGWMCGLNWNIYARVILSYLFYFNHGEEQRSIIDYY